MKEERKWRRSNLESIWKMKKESNEEEVMKMKKKEVMK